MTAADLVAGARALIEPLTKTGGSAWIVADGANSHCFDLRIVNAAGVTVGFADEPEAVLFAVAPVMRDTIAALLDDRDALTQRIEALEAALRFYIDPDNWLIGGPLDGDSPNYTGGPGRAALQADEVAP